MKKIRISISSGYEYELKDKRIVLLNIGIEMIPILYLSMIIQISKETNQIVNFSTFGESASAYWRAFNRTIDFGETNVVHDFDNDGEMDFLYFDGFGVVQLYSISEIGVYLNEEFYYVDW
jgi:hypothetical protein